jgi:hypothetical protein
MRSILEPPEAQPAYPASSITPDVLAVLQPKLSPHPRHRKRKADSDLLLSNTSPKRRQPPTIPRPFSVTEPEPNSINAIMRKHCRTRLFVAPIGWTSQQLRLLECTFGPKRWPQPSATPTAADTTNADSASKQPISDRLIALLGGNSQPSFHQHMIIDLLAKLGIHRTL